MAMRNNNIQKYQTPSVVVVDDDREDDVMIILELSAITTTSVDYR